MKLIVAVLLGLTIGAVANEIANIKEDLVCNDYNKKGVLWEGHVSYRGGYPRCFYRESVYPHRVWNGTTVK